MCVFLLGDVSQMKQYFKIILKISKKKNYIIAIFL